ncbi:INO80 chromatin remodeling complex Ies1 [Histoplasma ohiense]|nr:INO80 chromatin remodeling complex Ies1 [Histoplasma ohiense (nom. inval.)]
MTPRIPSRVSGLSLALGRTGRPSLHSHQMVTKMMDLRAKVVEIEREWQSQGKGGRLRGKLRTATDVLRNMASGLSRSHLRKHAAPRMTTIPPVIANRVKGMPTAAVSIRPLSVRL